MDDIPKSAINYYKMWICMFPETWSESDLERFYMFVHRLLTFSKKERSRVWLEKRLKADCKDKLNNDDIEKYCELYQHLKAFKYVWKSQQAKLIAREIHEKNMEEARKKYL